MRWEARGFPARIAPDSAWCDTNPATGFRARRTTSTCTRRNCWRVPRSRCEGPFHTLTVDGGWADYEHSERDDTGAALATFRDREWDARAEAIAGAWGFLSESALGVQLQRRDFSALGEGADYLAPTRTQSAAVFGFAESPLGEALRLQFGARVEKVEVDGTPLSEIATSRGFTPVSASAGLVFDASEAWRVGFALSSAARAPAQTELFARGPHEGTATYETGDPSLSLERANSAELSLRWRGGRVHADGALWITRFSDYIYGELTGRSCSEEGDCIDGDSRRAERDVLHAARRAVPWRRGACGDRAAAACGAAICI